MAKRKGKRNFFAQYSGRERFTAFKGESSFFVISKDASPELYALSEKFPGYMNDALKSLGWFIRGKMRLALNTGGPPGSKWAPRSNMHVYHRLDLLRAGFADPESGEWVHGRMFALKKRFQGKKVTRKIRDKHMMDLWKARKKGFLRNEGAMQGRLTNSIRYKMTGGRVEIGALNPSAAMFLAAVQGGKRGSRGVFQYTKSQPITPTMRRAFWAAGIPLSKNKTTLEQEERPLVEPIFKALSPQFNEYLVRKITSSLAGEGIDWLK